MKKLNFKFKNFDTFLVEGSCTQRGIAISTAVSKIKERYGKDAHEFTKNIKEKGPEAIKELQDYVSDVVEPYLDKIEAQEKLQTNDRFIFDYDGLLQGCVSWIIVEKELSRMREQKNN